MEPKSSSVVSFDLNTQKGVMSLLAAVRQSALSSAEKNDLRDLIFLYTNGGGDVSVKIALEQKLRNYQLQPVAQTTPKETATPETKKPPLPFGSSRPSPVFKAPVVTNTSPKSVAAEPKKESETIVTPTKSPEPNKSERPEPVKVTVNPNVPKSEPAKVEKKEPVSETAVVSESNTPSAPQPKVEPKADTPLASLSPETNSHLERIKEIKAEVNKKVGNPVNLVDIDNQVGREYMNALLEAMKRLSGGQSGGMKTAMDRLEAAYAAVEKAVSGYQQKQEQPTSASKVAAEEIKPVNAAVQATPPVQPEQKVINDSPKPQSGFDSVSENPSPKAETIVEKPTQSAKPAIPQPSAPTPAESEKPEPNPWSTPADLTTPDVVSNPASVTAAQAASRPKEPSVDPVTESSKLSSISEEKKNLTPTDLPATNNSNNLAKADDPLFTPEIDTGLSQLLSDWSLFKKSGLFGTGPKGKDHPLYKQIANLQIPLLLAGRFEGANQEIKQSITDYMNGWRYEQGIIYEKGETFELYLRRVIKQILDLQKKRLAS